MIKKFIHKAILIISWAVCFFAYAQSGSISWPSACPSNNCPAAYTDANGVKVNVSSSYGTGTGSSVNLTRLMGSTAGTLGLNVSSSAPAATQGLGITMDYGINYNDAQTGNMVKIAFDKAVQGIGFKLYDITSITLSCDSYGVNGSVYNDQVIITGTDANGNTVNPTFTEAARGAYNSAATPQYIPGNPSYIVADQISVSGNNAFVTGGYININGTANNTITNGGNYAVSLDIAVSFSVAVKEIQITYKNFSAPSGDYFSYYKTNNFCPASLTFSNFAQGNINPQSIMVGNLSYTGIEVPVTGTVRNDNNGQTGGVSGNLLQGVTVQLYDDTGATLIAAATTDVNGNYSLSAPTNANYRVVVTPSQGFSHVSSTDATPTDGSTLVSVGTSAIGGINFGINQPPTVTADAVSGAAPESTVTVPNVLANDTDPNGGTLDPANISLVAPSGATGITTDAQGDVTGFTVPAQGTWALNANGSITFTPLSTFTGNPTAISYTVKDAAGLVSSSAGVSISFNPDLDSDNDGILDSNECKGLNRIRRGNFSASPSGTSGSYSATTFPFITGNAWTFASANTTGSNVASGNTLYWGNIAVPASFGNGIALEKDGKTQRITQALNNVNVSSTDGIKPQIVVAKFAATNGGNALVNSGLAATFTLSYNGTRYVSVTTTNGTAASVLTVNYLNGASGNLTAITMDTAVANWVITLPDAAANSGNLVLGFIDSTPDSNSSGDNFALGDISLTTCADTDGDLKLDMFDLDSDDDGCPDAIEGDENVVQAQLNPDGSINIAANGGVDANGVPNLVNNGGAADIGGDQGQGPGSAYNAAVNPCYCYKLPLTNAGTTFPSRQGITSLGRAGADSSNWPMVRQSAWTVLEAKTKGFVVNRVAFDASGNPVGIASANFVEGMMVYDTTNNCLKIYDGTAWACYSKQACP